MKTASMFNQIASTYDLLNRVLSFGMDLRWRKKCREIASSYQPINILDVAAGTGDLTLELCKLNPKKLIALDPAQNMLKRAQKKFVRRQCMAETVLASAEHIPYPDQTFDLITCAFGVRNFDDLETSFKEISRVLKDNGIFLVMEFGFPQKTWIRKIYGFYFFKVLPFLAKLFTKHLTAYKYLNTSVATFPYGKKFAEKAQKLGFETIGIYPLTMGVAYIYEMKKSLIYKT